MPFLSKILQSVEEKKLKLIKFLNHFKLKTISQKVMKNNKNRIKIHDLQSNLYQNRFNNFLHNNLGRMFLELAMFHIDRIGYSVSGFSFGFGEALRALAFFQNGKLVNTGCMDFTSPSVHGTQGTQFIAYVACWRGQMRQILGGFGDRTKSEAYNVVRKGRPWLKFVDPHVLNFNERIHYGWRKISTRK